MPPFMQLPRSLAVAAASRLPTIPSYFSDAKAATLLPHSALSDAIAVDEKPARLPASPHKLRTTTLRHADLQQASFLLQRAGELAGDGRQESAKEFYRAGLTGLLRAVREEDGSMGESAAKLLAEALVVARAQHEEEEESDDDDDDDSESETDGERTVVATPGSILGMQQSSESIELVTIVDIADRTAVVDGMEYAGVAALGEESADTAKPAPAGSALIDFVILLVHTLLASPFVQFLHSTQRHFLLHLHRLSLHYRLADALVDMTRMLGSIAGWCDRRWSVGRRVGQAGAVSIVGLLKLAEMVVHQVAVSLDKVDREEAQRNVAN